MFFGGDLGKKWLDVCQNLAPSKLEVEAITPCWLQGPCRAQATDFWLPKWFSMSSWVVYQKKHKKNHWFSWGLAFKNRSLPFLWKSRRLRACDIYEMSPWVGFKAQLAEVPEVQEGAFCTRDRAGSSSATSSHSFDEKYANTAIGPRGHRETDHVSQRST